MEHLVYCDKKFDMLNKILTGTKTMIISGAAGCKLPHGRVFEGETLFFVENDGCGLIKAKATVKSVFNSEKMTEDQAMAVVAKNQDKLNLSKAQIERWAGKKVLCLIEIHNVSPVEPPLKYDQQNNMDDWITVENLKSILEGSSEK